LSVSSVKGRTADAAERPIRPPRQAADLHPSRNGLDPDAAQRIEQRTIDGLEWTFRERFGAVLKSLPAKAWTDPAGQGWEEIKHNAVRAVWRARIDRSVYYLKYYADRGWLGGIKRLIRGPVCKIEFKCGTYALEAGVPVVRPAGCCPRVVCGGRCCALLVTEAFEPAYPLSEYWQTLLADDDPGRGRRDRTYLINLLAEMIARAHQAGFEHRDMHPANILVHPIGQRRYETAFVDLQNARVGRPLGDRTVVRNLGQLNQWFRRHASIGDRLRFLRRYVRWRNEYEQSCEHSRPLGMSYERLVHALAENAQRHAERLWAKRDRRARRSGRYFARVWVQGGWRALVYLQCKRPAQESLASSMTLTRAWWRAQLGHPLRRFERSGEQACKESHSAWVARAMLPTDAGPLPVIVKRPLARNWRRRVRQLFAPSRSMRGWRIGNALLHRDIPTARPLAVIERRIGPLVFDSLLLTEAVPGALDLDAYLRREYQARSGAAWWRHKRELSALLVRHVRRLAERGFVHRDCKAQNVLVLAEPRLTLLWIDLDGLKRVGSVTRADEFRALTRLHVSLLNVPGLTRTDWLRFLKAYLAGFSSDARAWRDVWRSIAEAAQEKLRARWVRRRWKVKHYGRE
jgi:tRNA A-37 threonylcarbamoyl transferase component Bud32